MGRGVSAVLGAGGWVVVSLVSSSPGVAQITPDASLGAESSRITTDILINNGLADRIDGGAIRANNLFHSFLEFNVGEAQRVYFANPAAIDTIVTRVTGLSASQILGTLGVDGPADLYLINPNGLIFGPNAVLDIRGTFVGSTADGVAFSDGYTFSAVDPAAPPLLVLSAPLGLASWLPTTGTLTNQGNLAAGEDLALAGSTLDLQGQIQAGNTFTAIATDRLQVQDTVLRPVLLSAGGDALLQGHNGVDIQALAHPDSRLVTGGDLVLRSNGQIIGDARYFVGGDFRVEQLTGQLGSFASPTDPVIRASGDVSFDSYIGASLHILAGGSVTAGDITVTGPDLTGNALQETVTLSDGSTVAIDGGSQPTVDIRAGTLAFGTAGIAGDPAGFAPAAPATVGTGTSANIAIGSITNPGGLVFLTNQYVPNPALTGDITVDFLSTADFNGGGEVVIDSRGELTLPFVDASGGDVFAFFGSLDPGEFNGNGGDLTFLAEGTITFPEGSEIYAYGVANGSATVRSNTAIVQEVSSFFEGSTAGIGDFNNQGGDFQFSAPLVSLNGRVILYLDGDGTGGSLLVDADTFANQGADPTIQSIFETIVFGLGRAGNVAVEADTITLENAVVRSSNQSFFDPEGLGIQNRSGDVSVVADTITLDNSFIGSLNQTAEEGRAGDVALQTRSLTALNGSQIGSVTGAFQVGDAGNVTVSATESISLDGFLPGGIVTDFAFSSGIVSTIDREAEGNGGQITVLTETLSITNGAQIRASSLGVGDAGNVNIQANEALIIDGAGYDPFENRTFPSGIVNEVILTGTGQAGNVTITTPRLVLTDGGEITVSSDSAQPAGNIQITASELVSLSGLTAFDIPGLEPGNEVQRSTLRSESLANATGQGGSIVIVTPTLSITDGATLEARAEGAGDAGSMQLTVSDTVQVDGAESAILVSTAAGSTGNGGNLSIDTSFLSVTNGATLAATTAGSGDAGRIKLTVSDTVVVEGAGSGILANTLAGSTGDGGDIVIDPQLVLIRNGGRIAVDSQGAGDGGNIDIISDRLQLDSGLLSAETVSADGGNITLTIADLIILLDESRISTTAGTALAGGNGGNIRIGTTYIIATPNNNNDITANAFSGAGGSVLVTAEGIFGLVPRSRAELEQLLGTTDPALLDPIRLPTSDITAISRTDPTLDGTVNLQSPDIDPSQGVIALPDTIVDASRLIAQGCSSGGAVAQEIGSLVVTGRGGLPTNPTETLNNSPVRLEWATVETGSATPAATIPDVTLQATPHLIQEVQSLALGSDGQVVLLGSETPGAGTLAALPSLTCAGELPEAAL